MKKIVLLTAVLGIIVTAGVWIETRCWWFNGSQWIEQTGVDSAYGRKWLLDDEQSGSCNKAEWNIHFTDSLIILPATRTSGYWKTHPAEWPMGYNPNDSFFRSGKTWMQVLWTPAPGNAYYILAHQYIAAVLNRAAGCWVPTNVQTIIESATDWFRRYSPPVKSSSAAGRQAIIWAERLEIYNNTGS